MKNVFLNDAFSHIIRYEERCLKNRSLVITGYISIVYSPLTLSTKTDRHCIDYDTHDIHVNIHDKQYMLMSIVLIYTLNRSFIPQFHGNILISFHTNMIDLILKNELNVIGNII